jgi:prepilin-type N-terminal cleavage/methylation domain-containing protein
MKFPPPEAQRGFTLIELTTVLLIIGLLIGGVFAGINLKRGAELQSMITDENKYVEAARQFKEKYGYLPGDFPKAQSYWGINATGCPQATNQTATQTTCNGNGDGMIESDGNGNGTANSWENDHAWVQLADAGYIQGSYTGAPGTSDNVDIIPGTNAPATKRAKGGLEWYVFTSSGTYAGNGWWFAQGNYYKQFLLLGAQLGQGVDLTGPIMTGPEAQSIDAKIDDGLPGTGMVTSSTLAKLFGSYACANSNTASTAGYSNDAIAECTLLFQINW